MSALISAAASALLPIRILAIVALLAVIFAFVYVLSHLKKLEQLIATDQLAPTERGPRNNLVLMICAIPIIVVGLLLFLIIKT